jgi:hypothetical protein
VPPITELSRIEPVHLARLEKQGVFTTGILLEASETITRRQTLADHVKATTNDVLAWRDEALMLNLAGFGPTEHQLFVQAGLEGLRDVLDVERRRLGVDERRQVGEHLGQIEHRVSLPDSSDAIPADGTAPPARPAGIGVRR